jgi:hypothetical protein
VINHKKREKKARNEGVTSQKKSLLNSEQVHLSYKEILGAEVGYKYPTISCSFEMDDTQEIQEREISWHVIHVILFH